MKSGRAKLRDFCIRNSLAGAGSGAEPPMTIEEIIDNFSLLDDWDDRYRYVIELGRSLDPLPEEARNDVNKVQGCASQVLPACRGPSKAVTGEFARPFSIRRTIAARGICIIFSCKVDGSILNCKRNVGPKLPISRSAVQS